MKIKPIVKVHENKGQIAEWIIQKFPENYQKMNYFEPFVGSGYILLNKEPSIEEVINDADRGLINVWRAIRDEYKNFYNKVKRVEYKESIFEKYKNKKDSDDYMNNAVAEFVIRQMSKSNDKKSFLPKEKTKKVKEWNLLLERFEPIFERIKNVYILNRNALEIINSFSNPNCFMYCDPPSFQEKNPEMDANQHIELGEILNDFRGKVLISAQNSSIYKRIYAGWNRKGVPGKPKESIWLNF